MYIPASAQPPPTKEGKNNGYRQTNAGTVNIIKYINFFDGPVKKWHLNGTVLRPVFTAQKYPSKHLKQTPRRAVFFSKIFGKNRDITPNREKCLT